MKNMNNNNKTVTGICNIMFFHIFHIHNSLKQWNLISDNTFHKLLKCKPCVGAKLVLPFQALITHTFLDRSILFLYRESACTSGSISLKWISFISRFGAIVSYFVRGDIFFDSPCTVGLITSPPIGGGRGIVMPMSVCLFVCVCVCLSVFSQNFKV